MARTTVDWNSTETWQRVIGAMFASGYKPNIPEIAKYFGSTYDTIENRFRKIKKDAAAMKKEVDNSADGDVLPSRAKSAPTTPRKPKTPRKALAEGGVASGRVSKTSSIRKKAIKKEHLESQDPSVYGDDSASDEAAAAFGHGGFSFDASDDGDFNGDGDHTMMGLDI